MSQLIDRATRFTNRWLFEPGGWAEVFALALPMVISTASNTVMQFTDRLFLIWYSQEASAAAMPAGALQFAITSLVWGIAMYCNAFVAQYYGAKQPERIGPAVWQGVLLAILTAPAFLAIIPLAPAIFNWAGHTSGVQALEIRYFQLLLWGSPAIVMSAAFSAFYSGRGLTTTVMLVSMFGAVCNIVLDWAWIFGHAGFPRAGIEGAALATVVSQWIVVLIWLTLFLLPENRRQFNTLPRKFMDGELFGRLLWFGFPQGLQFFVEIGCFSIFLLVVGRLGSLALVATNLALNINSLAFMPVFGVGIATETLVGQRIGEKQPEIAATTTWSAFGMSACYTTAIGLLYFLCGEWLLYLHELNAENPADFAVAKQTTLILLRFVALYCLFDTMQIIFSCAIKGAGDTRFVMYNTLATAGLPVIASYLGVVKYGWGLYWCWTVLTLWVSILGIIYLARFLAGYWKKMSLVEPAPLPETEPARAHGTDAR